MRDPLHDAFAGIPIDLPARNGEGTVTVTVPALRFADAMRFRALSARVLEGDAGAAAALVREVPLAAGLPDDLPTEVIGRVFEALVDDTPYMPAPEEPRTSEESPFAYTMADLIADYAATYGVPDPDTPWPLFLALLQRTPRFEARGRLQLLDGVAEGIGAAMAGGPVADLARDALFRAAYPTTRTGPPMALVQSTPQPEAV